jgi:MFS transporter, DHA1 family, multidrug resistance protein
VLCGESSSVEAWKRNLYSLWAVEFLAVLGMALVLPFLPFYVRELGVRELEDVKRWSGFIYAAPFSLAIFSGPLWGWLGDRYGRRMMLIRAVFGFAVTSFLMAFAQNVTQLFLLRLIQGGVAGFIAATLAIVATTTPRERMGYAMGILQTSLTTGGIIGPLVGGFLADLIGYRNIFFLTGGFGFLAGFLVIFLVREDAKPKEDRKSPGLFSNYRFVFTSPTLTAIFVSSLIVQLAIMAIQPVLSLFVEILWPSAETLSTMAGAVFGIAGFSSLLAAPYWGKRGDRTGYKKTLAIATLATGISYAPQGLVTDVFQLLILRFILGLFAGGILPALYTLTTLNTPEERRGGIMGITRSGLLLGNVLGPISGGFLGASLGMRSVFVFTAVLLVAVTFSAKNFIKEPPH